jgi:metal-responsive CopG/Arc/MetJ family transcriptional regulator
MSKSDGQGDNSKTVSAKVDEELSDEFDMALKKAQIEGVAPMGMNRSEALRNLMRAAIDDHSLFAKEEAED